MTTYDAKGMPQFATSDKIAANGDGLREDLNLISASASAAIGAEGGRAEAAARSYADGLVQYDRAKISAVESKNTAQDSTLSSHEARLANLDNAAGFTGDPLALNDAAVKTAVTNGATTKGALDAAYASKTTVAAASDPLAYLDNVALLCEFPVRENGETLWPQGFSINKAANEVYVSNSDGPGAVLRIDVRDLVSGARKSYKTLTVPTGTFSQALPWFYNSNGDLCFIIRATASAQTNPSNYAVYNYTAGTVGANININGSTNADVSGNYFVTSDAWVTNATTFYVYDWASVKAGTPTLLATVPVENAGATLGKVQGIAIVGSHLYLTMGAQGESPSITAYTFTGRLEANRAYSRADFQAAVNLLKPGYLTDPNYIYEAEGGTNLDGKLVTLQIVNNNTAVTADGRVLILQHNRVDGAPIKSSPLTTYVRDTGWQTVTLNTGWTVGGSLPLQVRRIGNMVRLRGQVINADPAIAATFATVGTLPAGFRPPGVSYYFPVSGNTTTTMSCRIDPGGGVNLWASATTGAIRTLNGISYLLD